MLRRREKNSGGLFPSHYYPIHPANIGFLRLFVALASERVDDGGRAALLLLFKRRGAADGDSPNFDPF